MNVIDDLMAKAFPPGRPPRSSVYVAGVRALLARKIIGTPIPQVLKQGSVDFDAFHAGVGEGHLIYREYRDAAPSAERSAP